MDDQSGSEDCRPLELAYQRASQSYEAIIEFRAKLLAFLPLVTGTGVFLLLQRTQPAGSQQAQPALSRFLGPIGIFGVVVTLGLFAYELRGMQRCHRLEVQAAALEKKLKLDAEHGPFRGQPPRALGGMLGPPAAGLIIYLATASAWVGLAGSGFGWWKRMSDMWGPRVAYGGLLVVYVTVLAAAWAGLSWWLRRAATGRLPTEWKTLKVEMPPIDPKFTFDAELLAAKEQARKQELAAERDRAEQEYLEKLHEALLEYRSPAAKQNRQQG